jgi:mRNA-degrading endonuclease toxin of MazEF toxin-antitoxin module
VVNQGEIYEHTVNGSRFRVLIVSSDSHNVTRTPWIAPIRHGRADIPPYLVALVDADPLGGSVDLDRLRRALPVGEPLGLVTGATMSRVREAIATVFAG